jgi:hypothetical protein
MRNRYTLGAFSSGDNEDLSKTTGTSRMASSIRVFPALFNEIQRLEELAEYLVARGLRLIEDLSVAEVWRRVGRVPACAVNEFYRLAFACVEP